MTTVLQFICSDAATASEIINLIIGQINEWSRLQWLTNNPEYITQPWDASIFQTKVSDATTYWINHDSIYANLGDSGRKIADLFIGTPSIPGLLIGEYFNIFPGIELQLISVADLVSSGYESPPPQ